MGIKKIKSHKELPKKKWLVMYSPPYFSLRREDGMSDQDYAIACSVHEFEPKYGKAKMIYVIGKDIFIRR